MLKLLLAIIASKTLSFCLIFILLVVQTCYSFSVWDMCRYVYIRLCISSWYKSYNKVCLTFFSFSCSIQLWNKVFLYHGHNNANGWENTNWKNIPFFHGSSITLFIGTVSGIIESSSNSDQVCYIHFILI